MGIIYSKKWKSAFLCLHPKLWILFVCLRNPGTLFLEKKKCWEMLFCELSYVSWTFYNRKESPQSPFLTLVTKAYPSLLKNHTQQYCLPGFIVLMKIWSRAQKLSGKMPEISLSQMFQQKVLACDSLIQRHTGLSVATAI